MPRSVTPEIVGRALAMLNWEPASSGSGSWVKGRCPLPDHEDVHPSFFINMDSGGWKCHSCPDKGGLLDLLEKCGQGAKAQLKDLLWPRDRKEPTPADGLPSEELLRRWSAALGDDPLVADYFRSHAIDFQVAQAHGLGWDGVGLTLVVRDRSGKLMNVKKRSLTAGGAKWKGVKGRSSVMPYPLWKLPEEGGEVVCEGEADCLALRSMGVNAVTTTGGASSLTADNLGTAVRSDGQPVVIVTDADKAGQTARKKLKGQLTKLGIPCAVLLVPRSYNDVASWLSSIPRENRIIEWNRQVEVSAVGGEDIPLSELMELDGGLVKFGRGDEVIVAAPFTGRCVETGIFRDQGGEASRCFVFLLRHQDGSEITIRHVEGGSLMADLMSANGAGPKWSVPKRFVDDVRHHLCIRSEHTDHVDSGWRFGWEDEGRDKFWTRDAIISEHSILPNTQVRMIPPGKFSQRFNLPVPNDTQARIGGRCLVDEVARSHDVRVVLPMLAVGLAAPLRRLLFPDEARWVTFLRGRTGCGKTTRCRPIQSMFGSFPSQDQIVTWTSTAKAIETLMTQVGDSALLIDDLKRERCSFTEFTDKTRVLQDVSQGQGRMRANRRGELLELPEGRCLPIITCESLATDDEALIARSLVVDYPVVSFEFFQGPEQEQWVKAMEKLEHLPHATSTWIHHVMREYTVQQFGALRTHCVVELDKVLTKIPGWSTIPNSNRVANRLGVLTAVWLMFARSCVDLGWASQRRSEEMESDWLHACEWVAKSTFQQLREVGEGYGPIEQIMGLLAGGKAQIKTEKGWQPRVASPGATMIGFVEEDDSSVEYDRGRKKWQKLETVEGRKDTSGNKIKPDWRLFLGPGAAIACGITWRQLSEGLVASGDARVGQKMGARGLWIRTTVAKQLVAQALMTSGHSRVVHTDGVPDSATLDLL